MTYQKMTGTLSQGAHPGSYNGQDAYNEMLVTNDENICNASNRTIQAKSDGILSEATRLQGFHGSDYRGGARR